MALVGLELPGGYLVSEEISKTTLYSIYSGINDNYEDVWIKSYTLKRRPCKNAYLQESGNLKRLKDNCCGKTNYIVHILNHFEFQNVGIVILPKETQTLEDMMETLTEKQKIKIFYEVCCALEECYNSFIAHLDVTPRNIFIYQGSYAKLGNFSSSLRWSTLKSTSMKDVGDGPYKAPEITSPGGYMPYLVDYWSLGVLLHKMLADSYPIIEDGEVIIDENISEPGKSLALSLLQLHPRMRPPISFVLEHEVFTQQGVLTELRERPRNGKRRKKGFTHRLGRVVSFNLGKQKVNRKSNSVEYKK